MKRNLKKVLAKKKRVYSKRSADTKFTSYDTSQPETNTYQEVREEGESSSQLARVKKSKRK